MSRQSRRDRVQAPALQARRSRGPLATGRFGIAAAILVALLSMAPAVRAGELLGPLVQQLEPKGFTVLWSWADAEGKLVDAPAPEMALRVLGPNALPQGQFPVERVDGRYQATARGLLPGKRYDFELVADPRGKGEVFARGSARTSPPEEDGFRLLVLGDSGDGSAGQLELARGMSKEHPDVILHVGDLYYGEGLLESKPSHFFTPYREILSRAGFYFALGNHEYMEGGKTPALESFLLPKNGPEKGRPEGDYWFDYGCARFVVLDSNRPKNELAEVTAPWLDRVLSEAGDRWTIVAFHHPVFTHAGHHRTYRVLQTIVPVLDRHAVNLVFCGHNHLYERTYPVRAGKVAEDGCGTVYITTGAGGSEIYPAKPNPPEYLAKQYDAEHTYTVVSVSKDEIHIAERNPAGAVVDEATVRRCQSR
jgi:hypothetical protein